MQPLGVGSEEKMVIDLEIGDQVVVIGGPWKDSEGEITAINQSKQTVTINVEMFGRATPVEIGFAEVRKVG